MVEEPGHGPSQVVKVIPVLVSGLRQSETRCIIWARRLLRGWTLALRTGVADEPDEALIDRGHPSHASPMSCFPDPRCLLFAVGVHWGKIADLALVSSWYLVCTFLRSIGGTTGWWCGTLDKGEDGSEVKNTTEASDNIMAARPLLVTHRPANRSKAQESIGCDNQWRHFRLPFRNSILTMWGCMTHVSWPAVVHVIGFSFVKAYTVCGATTDRSHGREFYGRGLSGDAREGLSPMAFSNSFLAHRRFPGPMVYPNARGGKEKARK